MASKIVASCQRACCMPIDGMQLGGVAPAPPASCVFQHATEFEDVHAFKLYDRHNGMARCLDVPSEIIAHQRKESTYGVVAKLIGAHVHHCIRSS